MSCVRIWLAPGLLAVLLLKLSGSHAQTMFTDVTEQAGVVFQHNANGLEDVENAFGTGAAWFDYDRDGDLDLYVTQRNGESKFFANSGAGTFTEIGSQLGVSAPNFDAAGVAVADFNHDGWLDMYVAGALQDRLYKNIDGLRFADITASAGFDTTWHARGTSVSWGDYDNDGYLDLYVAQHINTKGPSFDNRDRIFHNNGDETFTDVTYLFEEEDLAGYGFIAAWTDFDLDGDPDIFLINDCPFGGVPSKMFRNDGGDDPLNWQFTEVGEEIGADVCISGMGVAVGDYNRDGWFDYYFTNWGRPMLLKNDSGDLLDATNAAGLNYTHVAATNQRAFLWGCNFFDYDLDGWPDLFVDGGWLRHTDMANPQPNKLYHNDGNGLTFTDVSDSSGLDSDLHARTSVFADYDQDGDLDLYVVNYGHEAYLYRNDLPRENNYLAIELQGTIGNRDGIGAKIVLTTPDAGVQYYETRSGSSLGGGDDLAACFGLGENTSASEITITWPSGVVQTLTDVSANQRLKVVESDVTSVAQTPGSSPVDFALLPNYPNPFNPATTISFRLKAPSPVQIEIYNLSGQRVTTLLARQASAGTHEVFWNARDAYGNAVSSGVYLVRMQAGSNHQSRKILYIR